MGNLSDVHAVTSMRNLKELGTVNLSPFIIDENYGKKIPVNVACEAGKVILSGLSEYKGKVTLETLVAGWYRKIAEANAAYKADRRNKQAETVKSRTICSIHYMAEDLFDFLKAQKSNPRDTSDTDNARINQALDQALSLVKPYTIQRGEVFEHSTPTETQRALGSFFPIRAMRLGF
ncbi:MAG TPA: hypothetical protein PLK94_02085 [Alphaproteobacteria bacterium]|nr:hypothetical protein [Alphaproteobacteria bacterium]